MTAPDPLTQSVLTLPEAGAYLRMGRSASYAAAKAGTFPLPVITIGTRKFVPTAALRRLLEIDEAPPAQDGASTLIATSAGTNDRGQSRG